MTAKRGIVHVSSHHPQAGGADGGPHLSGRELERVERQQRAWTARGYGVAPVPADGREHPEDQPCPACSEDARSDEAERGTDAR
jgi:hypothetical protein